MWKNGINLVSHLCFDHIDSETEAVFTLALIHHEKVPEEISEVNRRNTLIIKLLATNGKTLPTYQ